MLDDAAWLAFSKEPLEGAAASSGGVNITALSGLAKFDVR
jgi:hypothetical protein